jgi:uncharacterized membrane protein YphA (DoxX/SURF4 family)
MNDGKQTRTGGGAMGWAVLLGRELLAVGLGALGALNVAFGGFGAPLEPAPAWMPPQLAYLTGAILIGASLCVLANFRARTAAFVLAGVLLVWLLVFQSIFLFRQPAFNAGQTTPALEVLALFGATLILAGSLGADHKDRLITPGRFLFALTLPAFGALHYLYIDYVASVIPAWIPERTFWGYATGVAHAAAGLSILTGVLARLAAPLLGIMFGSWVLILHIPRVIADSANRNEWTSLFVATALCGGAWLVAGTLKQPEKAPPHAAMQKAA